jgi:phi13 family phage major tail protein
VTKVLTGLDMFHIAELTEDDATSVTYAAPEKLPGAVNVKVDPKTESETVWADNSSYAVLNTLGDIDVEIEATDLPLALQKKIFGHTEENGVQFASINDKTIELALGFRSRLSTGGYRYYWFLKGKPELLPVEGKTEEGKPAPQTAKLKLKFMPLQYNGRWKGQAEDGTSFTQGGKWFEKVVYAGSVLTPTV